ncbi:MAG: nucleoside phosphorylase [Thermoplasmata archaeon]
MINRYLPKVQRKVNFIPKFTAADFLRNEGINIPFHPKNCIIVFSRQLYKMLVDDLSLKESELFYRGLFQEAIDEDRGLYIVRICPGGPLTAATVEELASAGASKFLLLGTAGSINPKIRFGDLVFCAKAVRDEGTSYHYLKPSLFAYPSIPLTNTLFRASIKNGIKATIGITWTTDAPYMETMEEIEEFRNRGVLTVEMEAASLFAVSRRRTVESAAIFSISDELHGEKWTGMGVPEEGFRNLVKSARLFTDI